MVLRGQKKKKEKGKKGPGVCKNGQINELHPFFIRTSKFDLRLNVLNQILF